MGLTFDTAASGLRLLAPTFRLQLKTASEVFQTILDLNFAMAAFIYSHKS